METKLQKATTEWIIYFNADSKEMISKSELHAADAETVVEERSATQNCPVNDETDHDDRRKKSLEPYTDLEVIDESQ